MAVRAQQLVQLPRATGRHLRVRGQDIDQLQRLGRRRRVRHYQRCERLLHAEQYQRDQPVRQPDRAGTKHRPGRLHLLPGRLRAGQGRQDRRRHAPHDDQRQQQPLCERHGEADHLHRQRRAPQPGRLRPRHLPLHRCSARSHGRPARRFLPGAERQRADRELQHPGPGGQLELQQLRSAHRPEVLSVRRIQHPRCGLPQLLGAGHEPDVPQLRRARPTPLSTRTCSR